MIRINAMYFAYMFDAGEVTVYAAAVASVHACLIEERNRSERTWAFLTYSVELLLQRNSR